MKAKTPDDKIMNNEVLENKLFELRGELSEGIFCKNMTEVETKFNVGKQLLDYPELVPFISAEAHYYVKLAEYDDIEQALTKLGLDKIGKKISWSKIKRKLK
jgi:hypothetical protein